VFQRGVRETHLFWGQKVKFTNHKNSDGVGRCTLASADFYVLFILLPLRYRDVVGNVIQKNLHHFPNLNVLVAVSKY